MVGVYDTFFDMCANGNLEEIKHYIAIHPQIDIHYDNEFAFICACRNGRLDIVKYLWSLDQNIDIHARQEEAFRLACMRGHLDVVKYLWSLDQNIDIHVDDDYAFRSASRFNHLDVVKYLCEICDEYSYEINRMNDDGYRIMSTIRKTIEVKENLNGKYMFNMQRKIK